MLVTSEIKNDAMKIYELYYHILKIEDPFRVMKTYSNAPPIYKKGDVIYIHFLICYLTILLISLLQQDIFKGVYIDTYISNLSVI